MPGIQKPAAPAVYRPAAPPAGRPSTAPMPAGGVAQRFAGPGVYRPSVAPVTAPPAYRPPPAPASVQKSPAMPGQRLAAPAVYRATALTSAPPLVYRPAPAHPAPVTQGMTLQLKKRHAVAYVKEHGLRLAGGTVSQESVLAYVNRSSNLRAHRVGLLRAWNWKQTGQYRIAVPKALKPKPVKKVSGGKDLLKWDSDDDDSVDLSSLISVSKLDSADIHRPSTGLSVSAPVVPLDVAVRVGRQAVKRKEINEVFGVPIVAEFSGHRIEFAAPRDNDIVAFRLRKNEDGEYEREGGVGAWKGIAQSLEDELSDDDQAAKRKRARITEPFKGTFAVKSEFEAEAVGAIACDFMKGSGNSQFLLDLEGAPDSSKPGDWFTGDKLVYKPAASGGRSLATKATAKKKLKKGKSKKKPASAFIPTPVPHHIGAKVLHDVGDSGMNCLIRAILYSALGNVVEAHVGIMRQHLIDQNVAMVGQMLDLAGVAGSILVTFMVEHGILGANQGIRVHIPDGLGGIAAMEVS